MAKSKCSKAGWALKKKCPAWGKAKCKTTGRALAACKKKKKKKAPPKRKRVLRKGGVPVFGAGIGRME